MPSDRHGVFTRRFIVRDAGKEGLLSTFTGAAPARQRGLRARQGYYSEWEQPPLEQHVSINIRRARKGYSQFEQPPPVSGTRGGRRLLLAWPADRCQREPWTHTSLSSPSSSRIPLPHAWNRGPPITLFQIPPHPIRLDLMSCFEPSLEVSDPGVLTVEQFAPASRQRRPSHS